MPIFPELLPHLQDLFDRAEPGSVYVIEGYRDASNANLRTQAHRYIRQAGLQTWIKTFHNMRASCSTDLAQDFPSHVAAAWLGHSPVIAAKHYLQVREDDFAKAVRVPSPAAQKTAQQTTEIVRMGRQPEQRPNRDRLEIRPFLDNADDCRIPNKHQVHPVGLEPTTF